MHLCLIFTVLTLALPWTVKGSEVQEDLKRQKFIFSFPRFHSGDLKVFVSGKPGTQVRAESDGTNIQTIEIGATKRGSIELPNTVCYSQSETVSKESVQLSATDDIFAVVRIEVQKNAEAVSLIPVPGLSQKYFIVTLPSTKEHSGYKNAAVLTITALADNTVVIISLRLSGACSSNSILGNGVTVMKLLNRYDAYGIFCDSDMMGTMVESSSPVAVLSGRAHASIPIDSWSHDTIVHMMPPIELYGTEFVLQNLAQASALYRAVGAYFNTNVSWASQERTLQPGDHVDIDTAEFGETCLTSTMPILVVVFYKSGSSLPWQKAGLYVDYGDPFMSVVQATHQFRKSYMIPYIPTTSVLDYTAHVAIVLSSAEDKTLLTGLLDDTLGVTYKEKLVCNRFSVFSFQPNDQETVSVDLPYNFGVMFFGIGERAGLAFYGDTYDPLSPLTSTSTTVSAITSTDGNLMRTTQPNYETLATSMILYDSNLTTTPRVIAVSSIMDYTPSMMTSPTITSGDIFISSLITSTSNSMIITLPISGASNLPMLITSTIVPSTAVNEVITTSTVMSPVMATLISHLIPSSHCTQSSSYISISTTSIIPSVTISTSISTTATPTSTTTVTIKTTSTTTTSTTSTSTTAPVLLDKNGQPVRTVSTKCSCFCKNKDRLDEYTDEAAKETKKKIKSGLVVKTSTLAKAVGKKKSAEDKRSSASMIGWLALGLMILPVLFIVGVDLLNICSYCKSSTKIDNMNQGQTQEVNEDLEMNRKDDKGLDPDTSLNQCDYEDDIDLDGGDDCNVEETHVISDNMHVRGTDNGVDHTD